MEEIFEKTMLYDFYGELLTPHQKKVYEAAVFDDLSLSEIAQDEGISRQGVHDLIKRCNHILNDYEQKLHLVEKFLSNEKLAREVLRIAKDDENSAQQRIDEIALLANQMIEEF